MSYENVKLWFAKDENNEIVTIDTISDLNKHNTYHCPVCGSDLKPKAIESKRITPHFAHVDASKCNSESQIHFWFKHRFLEKGDKFTVVSDKEKEYIVKDILVEKHIETDSGIYKPDVTIITECGNTIYFEMAFTNKKKVKDYLDKWLELKNIVVEIDIKQLMMKDDIHTFKALFYDGKCFNVKKRDTYYNTIGKYKEEKLCGNVDEKIKERIRKLDWFWEDVFRYKKGEISIAEMALSIDSVNVNDQHIIDQILNKQSCINILQDYKQYIKEKTIEKRDYIFNKSQKEILRLYGENHLDLISIPNHSINKISVEVINGEKIGTLDLDIQKINSDQLIQRIINLVGETIDYHRKEDICDDYNEIANNIANEIKSNIKIKSFIKKLKKADFDLKIHTNNIKPTRKFLNEDIVTKGFKTSFKLFKDNGYSVELLKKINIKTYEKDNLDFYIDSIINDLSSFINGLTYLQNDEDINSLICDLRREYKKYGISIYDDLIWIDNQEVCEIILVDNSIYYINNFGIYNNDNLTDKIGEYNLDFLKNFLITEIEKMNKTRKCSDCNESFVLSMGEIKFFKDKGLLLPKRCKSCRDKRKLNKNN